jgi:hypothetical protein
MMWVKLNFYFPQLTHWQGRLKLEPVYTQPKKSKKRGQRGTTEGPKLSGHRIMGMVAIVRPMQNASSILEIRMDGNMFMSRHQLDMTFTFCDTRSAFTFLLVQL